MWIVRLALRRPYTFVVVAILIAVLGGLSISTMETDIFPQINIPVVSIIWSYSGLSPTEMEDRITTVVERALTTTVNDIQHMESQSLRGISVIKIFFQPGANVTEAVTESTSLCQTLIRPLPPGITPPLIIRYNAADVPVIQLSLGSDKLSQQQISDLGNNFIRTQLVTVKGAAVPAPYGGKTRIVNVDLDPTALYARGISPEEVTTAILNQNIIEAPGTVKMGPIEYEVSINSSPAVLDNLNRIPIQYVNGAMVYVHDVAFVHDGYLPQTNLVRRNGHPSALLPILTSGSASTLSVVQGVRNMMPKIMAGMPKSLHVDFLFDQSVFVRAAISGVVREGLIAACLTGLMILLFLRSWRSTLIVITSIPLAILTSICVLNALHQTLNIMTLGGLALAVGILVDDATVEIENDHRHLELGTPLRQAILDAAEEVATPAFVATLSICIVFVPIFLLGGVGGYLFTPLAMGVVFAMLASYFLSRSLVPTMVLYLLAAEERQLRHPTVRRPSVFLRIGNGFEAAFERFARGYEGLLGWALTHPVMTVSTLISFAIASLFLSPLIGRDFFPSVDAGQLRLHVCCPPGTRIEQSEIYFQQVEDYIRQLIPARELNVINDNIGLPNVINLARSDSVTAGPSDGEILVSLNPNHHPTAGYLKTIRAEFPKRFPNLELFTQPADIVSQILNFGLPSPIDIQFIGNDVNKSLDLARTVAQQLTNVPGAVDVNVHQVYDEPRLNVNMDRSQAERVGITANNIAQSVLVTLSGSFQTSPTFFLDPKNGVSYNIAIQAPQYNISSVQDLENIPLHGTNSSQVLANLADIKRDSEPGSIYHYDIRPVIDVYANVQDRDLGGVSRDVNKIMANIQKDVPKGTSTVVRGQVLTMNQSFEGLAEGLAGAIVLVYLLMVVNFQSWSEPFIIIMALPGALAGIVWMLFLTGTTLSVPALMGAIMCIGVATANSILVISFAKERLAELKNAHQAVLEAGATRLRPVMMTALAMIIGMVPMSLGLGEGGEQNAPLGRAVIGGLLVATIATLFFVPVVYSIIRGRDDEVAKEDKAGHGEEPVPAHQTH